MKTLSFINPRPASVDITAHEAAHPAPTVRDVRNDPAGVAAAVQTNLNTHETTHPSPTVRDNRNEVAGATAAHELSFDHDEIALNSGPRQTIDKSSSGDLTAAEMFGVRVSNIGQAGNVVLSLDPAAEGLSFMVLLGATAAFYYRIDPDNGDKIFFDGAPLTDGFYVQVASAAAGDAIFFEAFETAAGVYDWHAITVSGPWAAET